MPPTRNAAPDTGGGIPAWTVAAVLVVLHLALALGAYDPSPYVGGDNATYLALAHSLLERGTFVELWDPAMRPQALYPPLFPAVLALGMWAGLRTYVTLKFVVMGFSALGVLASYLWMRRAGGPRLALVGGLWLAIGPGLLNLTHWVLSDVPFWAFTTLAIWAFAHVPWKDAADADGGDGTRRRLAWIAAGAAATAAASLTRSAGLPLMLGAAVWLVMRRDWRGLLVYAAIAYPPWGLWTHRGSQAGATGAATAVFPWQVDPYRPELGTVTGAAFLRRIVDNTVQYAAHHVPTLLTGEWTGRTAAIVGSVVGLLALVGWARRLRAPGVVEVWIPIYLGLILAWPQNWSGERLILPVLPMLVLYALDSAAALARGVGARMPARVRGHTSAPVWAMGAACAGVLLLAVPGAVREVRTGRECTARFHAGEKFPCMPGVWRDFFTLGTMVRGRLPAGAVVIARKPTLWHMESGYRSRVYPFSAQPDTFFRTAREAGAVYVVEDHIMDLAPLYLHPVLAARPRAFCEVPGMALPRARLLRITAPSGIVGDSITGEENIPRCDGAARPKSSRRGRLRIGHLAP